MSTKLAIIDIDGVVADASARFAKAGEAKQAYLNEMAELQISDERGATDAYWEAALNPEHVYLDTLMASANAALNGLLQSGYHIVFLTSRPARMAAETLEWFSIHVFVERECDFIFKAPAFQYVKTVVWKAGMVQTLAAFYGADEVVFIDDEESNWTPLKNAGPQSYPLEWYTSLQAAVTSWRLTYWQVLGMVLMVATVAGAIIAIVGLRRKKGSIS